MENKCKELFYENFALEKYEQDFKREEVEAPIVKWIKDKSALRDFLKKTSEKMLEDFVEQEAEKMFETMVKEAIGGGEQLQIEEEKKKETTCEIYEVKQDVTYESLVGDIELLSIAYKEDEIQFNALKEVVDLEYAGLPPDVQDA